ncbi:hypothetical protein AYO45_03935 [Gammaproteobacteria bacterium SCGC AG-212-F23]|nr:hypothetical protein AYO45_03935 [Gammaproteobacteria bacterium SCGC AG-212-F23]
MVKSLQSATGGLTDWLIQRVSAIVMVIYSLALLVFLVMHSGFGYAEWHDLFASFTMKIGTLLFVLALLWHAWIGIWTVLTDYVKCAVLNLCLQVFFVLGLVSCFFTAFLVLWSI